MEIKKFNEYMLREGPKINCVECGQRAPFVVMIDTNKLKGRCKHCGQKIKRRKQNK